MTRKKARRRKPGSIRQTAALLHKAMTPAILIRSFKTYRQATAGGAIGTATLTGIQQFFYPNATASQAASTGKTGIALTLIAAVFAWLSSLIGNVITAAEKLVNDAPTPEEKAGNVTSRESKPPMLILARPEQFATGGLIEPRGTDRAEDMPILPADEPAGRSPAKPAISIPTPEVSPLPPTPRPTSTTPGSETGPPSRPI